MGEKMSRMRLLALALTVGVSALVLGQPALPNAPAGGPSSPTRSVAYLSVGESGRVWLAIGIKEAARLGQRPDMYSRILLYKALPAGRRWEKVLDLAGTRSLERLWFFGSGRIVAWFREPTRDVIFHSADGGTRWRSSPTGLGQRDAGTGPSLSDMSFISPTEGWMLVSTCTGMLTAYPRL